MKKLILLLLFSVSIYGQTLQNPTFGNITTNTLKIKTPATVTSVNFLPAFDADGVTVSKIDPVNLPFISASFTSGRVPYTTGTKTLADSNRFLWNNTASQLEINGNAPTFKIKENLNNSWISLGTTGSGSTNQYFKNQAGRTLAVLENPQSSGEFPRFGIGEITAIPVESQLFVYGGVNGGNIDARGSSTTDEANIDLENADWATAPKSLGFSYFGIGRPGTVLGYARTNMAQIRFQENTSALITSSNTTPIRFGINQTEIANIGVNGWSYQSDFSSANSANNRWLVDKGYVDGLNSGNIKTTGNQTKTGTISFANTTTSLVNGISISNSGGSGGNAFYGVNTGAGDIMSLANNSTGQGIRLNTTSSGIGIGIGNTGSGIGMYLQTSSTGDSMVSNVLAASSGFSFVGQNNGTNTFTVSKAGAVTGSGLNLTAETVSTIATVAPPKSCILKTPVDFKRAVFPEGTVVPEVPGAIDLNSRSPLFIHSIEAAPAEFV